MNTREKTFLFIHLDMCYDIYWHFSLFFPLALEFKKLLQSWMNHRLNLVLSISLFLVLPFLLPLNIRVYIYPQLEMIDPSLPLLSLLVASEPRSSLTCPHHFDIRLHLHMLFSPVCVCVCLSGSSHDLLIRTPAFGLRAHPNLLWLHLNFN